MMETGWKYVVHPYSHVANFGKRRLNYSFLNVLDTLLGLNLKRSIQNKSVLS